MPNREWILAALAGCMFACGGDKAENAEAPKIDVGAPLGVLELPVSLRSSDPQPGSDARKVEASLAGLRIDGEPLLVFESGRVPAAERSGDEITKLKAALQTPAKPGIALSLHASLPYETAALVISTAKKAGIKTLSLQVRKPGASTTAGWLTLGGFQTTPRTDDEVPFENVQSHTWDEFVGAWQAIYDGCRTGQTGVCAYVETNVSKGGQLKIVLHASGQGVNVDYFRVGITPEQRAAELAAHKAEVAAKKEDVVQGRKKQTDVAEEMVAGDPATEALFQFRDREAFSQPSPLTEVMKPLCGSRACGAVVSADENTLVVRVVSLIGGAFADGSAAPTLAFELPWTPKPKPVVLPTPPEPAPAAEPEAPKAKSKAKAKAKPKKKK